MTKIAKPPAQPRRRRRCSTRPPFSDLETASPKFWAVAGVALFGQSAALSFNLRESYYGKSSDWETGDKLGLLHQPHQVGPADHSWKPTGSSTRASPSRSARITCSTRYPNRVNGALKKVQFENNDNSYVTLYLSFSPFGINGGYYYSRVSVVFLIEPGFLLPPRWGKEELGFYRPIASERCMACSWLMPLARSNRRANSASEKPRFSPVAWISTMPPLPVSTNRRRPRPRSPLRSRGSSSGAVLEHAAADRRDLVDDRVALDHAFLQPVVAGQPQRHPGAGDRGGAGAAVGLDHVAAVEHDLAFAERLRVDHGARKERPISRWISCVRPLCLPCAASRRPRLWVARGSMPYSAVTQPWPLPFRNGGTPSSRLAVTRTLVWPKETRHEPSA